MTSPYYVPSNRVSAAALPIAIICSVAVVPGAVAYAWLSINTPVVFRFFVMIGFVFYLGLVVDRAANYGKVRSAAWINRAGVAIGLAGWYCQWAAWSAMTLRERVEAAAALPLAESVAGFAAHPGTIGGFAVALTRSGTVHIGGWHLTGLVLLAVWLIELCLHLGLPPVLGRMRAAEPFCESSGKWADKIKLKQRFAFILTPEVAVRVLEADPQQVQSVLAPWCEKSSPSYATVTVYRCDAAEPYITITNHAATQGRRGNIEWSNQPVVEYLRLPGIDPDSLMRQLESEVPFANAENRARPTPVALTEAVDHLQADSHQAALEAALPYVGAKEADVRSDANRVAALACCGLGRWTDALGYWQALLNDEPTAHNALQLASSAVMAGNLQGGITWLAKARAQNTTSCEMPDVAMLTNFVSALTQAGKVPAAMPYLEEIRQIYTGLGTTDATILYAHRVPIFSVFLEKSEEIVRAALSPEEARSWYLTMLPCLDEGGNTELCEWLDNHFATA